MKEEEQDPIEANYDAFSPLMRPEGRQAVQEKGFFEIDRDGDLMTPLVPGSGEEFYEALCVAAAQVIGSVEQK